MSSRRRLRPDLSLVVEESYKKIQNNDEEWYEELLAFARTYSSTNYSEEELFEDFADTYAYYRNDIGLQKEEAEYRTIATLADRYNPVENRFVEL